MGGTLGRRPDLSRTCFRDEFPRSSPTRHPAKASRLSPRAFRPRACSPPVAIAQATPTALDREARSGTLAHAERVVTLPASTNGTAMKSWHLFLCSVSCAISIQAADDRWIADRTVLDRGQLLVRWSEVESNSVRTSIIHSRERSLLKTNHIVYFRYSEVPEPAVWRTYELCRGERVKIRGRDGLTSVAGRLRSFRPYVPPFVPRASEDQKCTLGVEFDSEEEANIAAGYLAGRTRRDAD